MGVFALKDSSNRMLNLFAESSRSGLEAVDASGNLLIRIVGNGEGGNIRFNSKNLQHHWEMDANDNNIFRLYYGTNATHANGAVELSKQFLFNGTNCSITADRFIGVADSAKILTLHDGVTNATTRSTTASTWTGNVSGLRYVWGQAWKDTALGTDTGDLVLGLRTGIYTSSGTELCMMIDGDYYSMGNKVLHAGNYNDYAPTKTGGGASGTWGISITGNADTVDSLHATDFARHYYYTASTDFNSLTSTGWHSVQNTSTNSPTTSNHGLMFVEFDVGTPFQIWYPDNSMLMYKRWYTGGAWTSWSNTWQINITGNAGTASKLTDINTGDLASNSTTWRRMWISYNDNATGRPAYDDRIAFQTSTGTLKTPRIQLENNGITSSIGSENSGWLHYNTNSLSGHWFNTNVSVSGNIYAGTNYSDLVLTSANFSTYAAPASHSHSYLPLSGGTMSGDIVFSNSGTAFRSIWGTCGDNDQWRIGGGATGSNSGYMEIATADDGTEPIYVRQYTGVFSSLTRTLTLLDGSGNTSVPGKLTVNGKVELWSDSEGGNIRLTSPNGSWWSIDALNNSSMRFIWAESTVPFSFSNDGTISGTYFTGTANYANSAGSAGNANILNINNSANLSSCLQYIQASGQNSGNDLPSNTWWHVIKMNHGQGDTYYKRMLAFDFWNNNIMTSGAAGDGKTRTWSQIWIQGNSVTGAVWNDYAECREADFKEPGYVLVENGDDTLSKSTERLQQFAGISSDTWGFSQGETEKAKTHIAVAGRVLAYPYQDRYNYKPGDAVCTAPGGTVDIMTEEEIIQYPHRIVGTVSCVPEYEEWGGGERADRPSVKVNGRIWIKVK